MRAPVALPRPPAWLLPRPRASRPHTPPLSPVPCQVSEWPVLVVQPAGGLHFPAVEALREAVASRALEGRGAGQGAPGVPSAPSLLPGPQALPSAGGRVGRRSGRLGGVPRARPSGSWFPQHGPQRPLPWDSAFGVQGPCFLGGNGCCRRTPGSGQGRPHPRPPPTASPPRSAVLECSHVCSLDYTAVLGLRELLEDFRRRGLTLALAGLQVGVPDCCPRP